MPTGKETASDNAPKGTPQKERPAHRHSKDKNISEKTPALRKTDELSEWLLRKLCNEEVFPKRSRWLFSGKIADLVNDFTTCVFRANEIRVVTAQERDARHYYQTMAISNLMALDAKINQAQRVLDISPESLHHYAVLANDCRSLLLAWINSDEKRYGPPTRLKNTGGGGR